MHSAVLLDVCISTWLPSGIEKVADMNLPAVPGVKYIISWQNHQGASIPAALMRPDIKVVRFSGNGLAANRNNAIRYGNAPIILIADDDLRYTPDQLQSVISAFNEHEDAKLIAFRYEGNNKHYPSESLKLTRRLPKNYFISSIEIAFRRECTATLMFDERFGLGSQSMHLGEDDKFLLDAIRLDMNCIFLPITITKHTEISTGQRQYTRPELAIATGCLIRGWYPWSWPLRIPLKAYRLWRGGSRFWFCLFNMLKGTMQDCSLAYTASARNSTAENISSAKV